MKPIFKQTIPQLLSRNDFRTSVFERDKYQCVVCGVPAQDAHHIIERRLFKADHEKGGYFTANGASVCEKHHIEAEQTVLSCTKIRTLCGITQIVLPEHFYTTFEYDKWGNMITSIGRVKGELYYSVQHTIKGGAFIKYFPYPKIYHLPYSKRRDGDLMLKSDDVFIAKNVVVMAKMDGIYFTGYQEYCHADNFDMLQGAAKTAWFQKADWLDDDMRICCTYLENKLFLCSIWVEDICLEWQETVEYAQLLSLPMPQILYFGQYDATAITCAFSDYKKNNPVIGYEIRLINEFKSFDFDKSVAQFIA